MAKEHEIGIVRAAKATLAVAAASLVLAPATTDAQTEHERPIVSGIGTADTDGNYLDMTLSYGVNSGATVCTIEKHHENTLYGTTLLLAEVQTQDENGEWRLNRSFKRPLSVTEGNYQSDHASAELVTRFSPRRIWKLVGSIATRIVCYGSEKNSVAIELPDKKPTDKNIFLQKSD